MKILIADGSKVSQLAFRNALENERYGVEICSDGDGAIEILKKDKDIRIVILDQSLPDMDALTLAAEIKKWKPYRYIMTVLPDNKNDIIQAMEAGIDDYITKPFDNDIFIFRIRAGVKYLETEDKFYKSQKELIRLVKEDPLTTLLNRRAFLDEAIKQVERASREGQLVSAILADIDEFSQINESYGNSIGDRILVEFANRLRLGCRPYDTVGRFSGEKFIVLLPNTKAANAVKVAKRLRSAVTKKYYDVQEHSIKLTIGLGVSFISPDVGPKDKQIDELIKKTQVALEKAKSEGKERIALNVEQE